MKSTTAKQIEMVLRKYTKQLKEKDAISVNEAGTLARLTSACHRLTRSSGGKSVGMSKEELEDYTREHGSASFYEEISGA